MAGRPPVPFTSSIVGGSVEEMTSHTILPTDARRTRARWISGGAIRFGIAAYVDYTLTRGTLGTEPRGEGPPPFGPDGLRRGLRRLRLASGIFSGFGVTGPSRYSKPSFSIPDSSFVM